MKGRHLEILVYLLKHKKTTYQQLAHRLEVSKKTIERDINRLSAMGIPVYCTQGVGGGVQIDENYQFGTSFFTNEDLREMIFALKIVDSLAKTPKKNSIISKLGLISPEWSLLFEQDAQRYLSIDLLTEKVDTEHWIMEKIDHCLDEEVFAILNDSLTVAPIGYVLKTDGLHLFCRAADYCLIPFREIEKIDPTDTDCGHDFISYEEYRQIAR